jgi:hypothetical protein
MAAKKGNRRLARTAAAKALRTDDKARAWKLYVAGMTFRDISRILECSLGRAHALVKEMQAEIPQQAREETLAEVVARQRAVIKALWKKRGTKDGAQAIQGSDRILIDVLGLAAPKKAEVTADVRVEPGARDDVLSALATLAAQGAVGSSDPQSDG